MSWGALHHGAARALCRRLASSCRTGLRVLAGARLGSVGGPGGLALAGRALRLRRCVLGARAARGRRLTWLRPAWLARRVARAHPAALQRRQAGLRGARGTGARGAAALAGLAGRRRCRRCSASVRAVDSGSRVAGGRPCNCRPGPSIR